MPNIQTLKRNARALAEGKGHRFAPNGFHAHDGTRATAICLDCGAGVTVDVFPVKTFGEAIEETCEDVQKVGGEG